MELLVYAALFVVFLTLNAIFNGSETGLVSLDVDYLRFKARSLGADSKEKRLLKIAQRPENYLALTLIGINSCLVIATSLATSMMHKFTPHFVEAGTFVMSAFVFLFCEFMPKMAFSTRPLIYCLRFLPLYRASDFIFKIPIKIITGLTSCIMRLVRVNNKKNTNLSREELLILLTHSASTGAIEQQSNKMAQGIIGLKETIVRELMVPRPEVMAIPITTPVPSARKIIVNSGFSRVPVFEGSIDKIVGVIYFKDLFLRKKMPNKLSDVISKPLFVPETKPASDLFREMRIHGVQMAVVLDEYASLSGIITLEDLVEQVFGEINDEFDKPGAKLQYNDDGSFTVPGDMHIEKFCELTGITLEAENGETTLNGLVQSAFGKIPQAGESCYIKKGVKARVIEASRLKAEWLRIAVDKKKDETNENSARKTK